MSYIYDLKNIEICIYLQRDKNISFSTVHSMPLYVYSNQSYSNFKTVFTDLSGFRSGSLRPFVVCYWTVIFFLKIFKFCNVHINWFEIVAGIHLCYSHVLNLSLMRFEIIFASIFDCTKKCLLVRLVHVCIYIRMVSVRLPSIWEVLLTMYFNSTKSTQWQFKMSNLTHLRSRYNHCLFWILKEDLKEFLWER